MISSVGTRYCHDISMQVCEHLCLYYLLTNDGFFLVLKGDANLEHELRNFREMSLGYVSKLHEVNEKKKFEFVEIVSQIACELLTCFIGFVSLQLLI